MVTQELVDALAAEFQKGKKRIEVEDTLMSQGFEKRDIYDAITHIQRTAIQQLPGVAFITQSIARLDEKTAKLPMSAILGILGALAFFVFLIAFVLYSIFDPMGTKTIGRDKQRVVDYTQMHNALNKYFTEKNSYPTTLDKLVPAYLTAVPVDPKTKKLYDYKILDDRVNYELCIQFETQSIQCVSSSNASIIPSVDSASLTLPMDTISPVNDTYTATPPAQISPAVNGVSTYRAF